MSSAVLANGPVLLCYDGSENAKHALRSAGSLFVGRAALVATVWQPRARQTSVAATGAMDSFVDFTSIDRVAAKRADELADEGVRIAAENGLDAEAAPTRASGSVWQTLLDLAEQRDPSVIVLGSRGLAGVRSALLGSVSTAVMHHAQSPTLVVHASPVMGAAPLQAVTDSRKP